MRKCYISNNNVGFVREFKNQMVVRIRALHSLWGAK